MNREQHRFRVAPAATFQPGNGEVPSGSLPVVAGNAIMDTIDNAHCREPMFTKAPSKLSVDELQHHAMQLKRSERDIRQRVEARSRRLAATVAGRRDLVAERLAWLLARVSARQHTAAAHLTLSVAPNRQFGTEAG